MGAGCKRGWLLDTVSVGREEARVSRGCGGGCVTHDPPVAPCDDGRAAVGYPPSAAVRGGRSAHTPPFRLGAAGPRPRGQSDPSASRGCCLGRRSTGAPAGRAGGQPACCPEGGRAGRAGPPRAPPSPGPALPAHASASSGRPPFHHVRHDDGSGRRHIVRPVIVDVLVS